MNIRDLFSKKKLKIGLALSGGATHGAGHIGVLQVLEREGIRPDFIAGTSAGALVGAAYCAGISLDELKELFLTMDWPTLLKISLKKPLSIFDTQPMETFLKKKIGDCEFKDLNIPFAAIGCDILTGEKVILDHGTVATAVRASAAIPGIFSPVEIENHLLVDGGIVDNLPIEQVRKMGANFIIASDVSNRDNVNMAKRPENPIEILLSMIAIMQTRSAFLDLDTCDCLIRPQLAQFSSWGFADADKMIQEGVTAAEKALPQLSKITSRK